MTIKVNGGPKLGTNVTGSLRHFKIDSTDTDLVAGVGIPNSGLDALVKVLQTFGTTAIVHVATQYAYVAFENTSCAVPASDAGNVLRDAIRALGTVAATVAQPDGGGVAAAVTFTTATVVEGSYVLA
jgi:hypothetical protein